MSDMLAAIEPKSDQKNFDDFSAGQTLTIKITGASVDATKEQKVTLNYENDNGKPYKPGKSMSRVLVHVWGDSSKNYIGKYLTLYGDPKVRFGKDEVGGIRISNMSHIAEPAVIMLTVSKGKKIPYTVKPLITPDMPSVDSILEQIAEAATEAEVKSKFTAAYRLFGDDESRRRLTEAKDKRKTELTNGSN